MKVLFLTTIDPREHPSLWSGIALNILKGIEFNAHQVTVRTIGHTPAYLYGALRWRAHRLLAGNNYAIDHDPIDLWFNRRRMRRQLRGVEFDLVFSWLPWHLDLVETPKPKVFWYDTTVIKTMPMYFPDMDPRSTRACIAMDRKVARAAAAAIYPSEWARQSAIQDYGVDPQRAHVIAFGANFEPFTTEQVQLAIKARQDRRGQPLRLLFVGMDWVRKRGQTAVDVTREINSLGVPARLTIVGCTPTLATDELPFVEILGLLDKRNPAELNRLRQLYLQSDYFIMTSGAESYGIVYCEAMACGLPSLATHTGGVGYIVRNGVTGFIAEPGENAAAELAKSVVDNRADPSAYSSLMQSTFRNYQQEFNWDIAWRKLGKILDELNPRESAADAARPASA
jgi:glycosyltransferase involved in cell wall biosynthesis